MKEPVYKWIEEIHIVNGYNRSCLYDLPRSKYYLSDKKIDKLRSQIDGMSIDQLKKFDKNEIGWIQKLIENEVIVKIPQNSFSNFIAIEKRFDSPSIVSNAVIEESQYLGLILERLTELFCYNIHIIVQNEESVKAILNTHFLTTDFQSVSFELIEIVKSDENLFNILEDQMFVSDVVVRNWKSETKMMNQDFTRIIAKETDNFSLFKPKFSIDTPVFMESVEHNTFYNGKLFVFENGDLSFTDQSEAFGNINNLSKNDIIEAIEITKDHIWASSKEKTIICNQCEFRGMCIDNRVPTKGLNDEWSLKGECSYNPFISKWEGETNYLRLNECGIDVDIDGLKIDQKKLDTINEAIWSSYQETT